MPRLIDRMISRGVPKSWITEVEKMLRTIEEKDELLEEYLKTIDNLARQVDSFHTEKEIVDSDLHIAWYQIERAVGYLSSFSARYPKVNPSDIIKSVTEQLQIYLETTGYETGVIKTGEEE